MRVAVSIPDELFKNGEAVAKQLKVPRSRLYATALAEYLKRLEEDSITERLNEIYSRVDSRLDEAWQRVQLERLSDERW